jgi:predicted ATPase
LGVPPLEETTKLYERILAGQLETAPTKRPETIRETGEALPSARPSTPHHEPDSFHDRLTTAQLPLVGRSNEWLAIVDWYSGVQAGGRLLVLEGEAGIGKTRLAQDFLAYARQQGATAVTAQCYQGESSLAYSPFIEGLTEVITAEGPGDNWRALPDFWLAEACRLVPDLMRLKPDLPSPSPLDSPGGQSRFFEAISRLIQALCGHSPPGILFLDDIYWTDEATLDLLAYLLRRLPNHPLFVILTWRA